MASILDGLPENEEELRDILAVAEAIFTDMVGEDGGMGDKAMAAIFEQLHKGVPLAHILGLSPDHLDAFFVQALKFFEVGNFMKAQDLGIFLTFSDPTDFRFVYLLAMTYQAQGHVEAAGKAYIQAIALDATNPDGYARLGECFMANNEYDKAKEMFETAMHFSGKGKGSPQTGAHAKAMLEYLEDRLKTGVN